MRIRNHELRIERWIEPGLLALAAAFTAVGFTALGLVTRQQAAMAAVFPAVLWTAALGGAWAALQRWRPGHDRLLLPVAGLLTGMGLVMVARLAPNFLARQVVWSLLGLGAMLTVTLGLRAPSTQRSGQGLRLLRRYRYTWLIGGLALLGLTLVFGVNPAGTGARLWLGFGGLYFQPSEPLKLLMVIFLASYFAEKRPLLTGTAYQVGRLRLPPLPYLGPVLLMWGFSLLFLIWQRDLGAAWLFFAVFLLMLYATTGQVRYVLLGLGLFSVGATLGYRLFDHVKLRVDIWLNPWAEASGRAFQIVQSLLAFAAGGLLGQGVGQGIPTFIPVVHSDFVFSAVGEEWGLLGTLGTVSLFALLVARAGCIALSARTPFRQLLAFGLAAMLGLQALTIMAGSLKLVPLTGVTLPFVSYGGSSLVTSFVLVGLLFAVESPPLTTTMHTNIHRALNLILILFLLVALWLGYWGVIRAPGLLAREDNPRRVEAERRVQRGRVLDRHGVPLAWSEVNSDDYVERRYAGDWLAHAVGYYSLRHGVGSAEAAFDEVLRGEAGRTAWDAWRDGLLHRPQIGGDVQLTLDAKLQQAASEVLGEAPGAVVLLDAQTGEVLALASQSTFDPNRLDEDWDALRQAPGRPLFNRATQGLYPPGAIFNLVVMAAALEEELTAPDEVFRAEVGEATVLCANHPDLVAPDLLHAAAYGCNAVFADLSLRLGSDRIAGYAKRFGVDRAPELEIPSEAGQLAGSLPLSPENLSLVGYGQGEVLVSPLQMALLAAAVANEGQMPRPTLLPNQPRRTETVLSPETAAWVRQAMALATAEGPARQAAAPNVTVAGKVGTAETGGDALPHAWFVGFAPAGPGASPRFAVAVVVEHGGEGGQVAAPIAGRLLELALAMP